MKLLFLLFVLLMPAILLSDIITVKDKETNEVLEYVNVSSSNPKHFAVTNHKGLINIDPFKGSNRIKFRHIAYKTFYITYEELHNSNGVVYLEPSNLEFKDVIVSATRWNQPLNEIPVKASIISKSDIELQNPQTSADLLNLNGDVYIQKSQQGGGSPMIRGFATNRLIIAVDGIRMNNAIFRSGNLQNVISIDPFSVSSTEVLFGPGSVIYGSDAIGGVMSFNTLQPTLSYGDDPYVTGNANLRYSSSNNENTGHIDLSVGLKKWAFTTSLSYFSFDDLRMGSNGPDDYLRPFFVQRIDGLDSIVNNSDANIQNPSGYNQFNIMQKVMYQANDNWNFKYGFYYSETSNYDRYDRHIRTRNGIPRSAEWYYGPQKWMMNNLTITNDKANKLYDIMTIRLAQQNFVESRHDRNLNDPIRTDRFENVDAYSVNLDLSKSLNKKNELYYGFEYIYNDVNSSAEDIDILNGSITNSPARYPESDWSSYALYLNYNYLISEKLTIQSGIRYNHFLLNSRFSDEFYDFPFNEANINDGALIGSMGINYRSEDWSFYSAVSTGFRSPNVDDIGKVFDSEPGSVVIPNPNLQAEYAYNFEVGLAHIFGDFLKVDLTSHYTLLDNALVRRDFNLNGQDSIDYDGELSQVQAIQNSAQASVFGVQAGLEFHFDNGLQIRSRINYQDGIEELDDGSTSTARHSAPLFGMTQLIYDFNSLRFFLISNYMAERSFDKMPEGERGKQHIYALDENGNPYSPGWYNLNFGMQYKFNSNYAVTAEIENITDQRYRPYSSGLSAPGRNFVVSLRAGF